MIWDQQVFCHTKATGWVIGPKSTGYTRVSLHHDALDPNNSHSTVDWKVTVRSNIEVTKYVSYLTLEGDLSGLGCVKFYIMQTEGKESGGIYAGPQITTGFPYPTPQGLLDWIYLTTTHVLQDILAVLHKWMCLKSCFHSLHNYSSPIILSSTGG